MNYIELMMEEHQNAKRMLVVIRKLCLRILNGENVNYEDFFDIIDFVRNYVDRHHHGKEENMLFNRMMLELGDVADKLVRHGMLVEHDMGRLYMQDLEYAVKKVIEGDNESKLDVIANAVSYANLLNRHIDKEDKVVYVYAQKNLYHATQEAIDSECAAYEKSETARQAIEKYIPMLKDMEAKYCNQ